MVRGLGPESLPDLVCKVAFPKPTSYGDYFEVESKEDPSNLAYTTATLGLHLDEQHYAYTPGVKILILSII